MSENPYKSRPWIIAKRSLIIIPKPLRDLAYRYVAKRRKLIFKQTKTCIIPTEEIKERFLS